ncbi:uncharacterized protein STEHIDRAFT_46336 [Stereum hirsutum FP-91666 SS1]|uniref:uncharacterized protein n=1 Tax=Stereum hirsutum (strain FP-91666) TaxID=721885 RepID=UPI000440AD75|nr:uncharacterized protein STEHIDRAFT_46336 [Stereum hirsutum FP-91666 SS1]EIM91796.1 hypothetical protein STEHIDRAFT_46336 [Stereum hirsutum FP-91666 SS1]
MLHIATSPSSFSLSILTLFSFSSILLLQASTATAKTNDWSVPCFQGRCAYDLVHTANSGDNSTSSSGGANGSLQIWGSTTGISDITSSAGWIILSCNPSAASSTTSNQTQVDVRLVCSSEDTSATGCDHLFANGAEGTLVRMPPQDSQNCTSAPFLRVAKAWIPEDQTISTSVKRSIIGRGDNSTVHALTLDTNFAVMDASKHGNVSFSIQAGSVYSPNTGSTAASSTVSSRRRGYHHSRRFFGAHTTSLESTPTSIAVSNSLATLISADVPCSASVASPTFSAGPVSAQAGVEASVDVNLDAQIQVGIVAAGSLIPPKITELGLTADFNASIDGKLNLEANVTGTIDSGTISLFQVGIPGLSFPGILTIGPSFAINAEAKATLEIDVDLTLDLAHNITNGHMVFPPGAASADQTTNNGQFVPSNTGLTFAANPELNGTASVEAHLIPTLQIGITAFEGIASANIFLDLDASAKLGLNGSTSASVTGTANSTDVSTTAPQGCVDVSAQLSVNAGADAKFFSIFDETVQVPLFDKTFDIFQVCASVISCTPRR